MNCFGTYAMKRLAYFFIVEIDACQTASLLAFKSRPVTLHSETKGGSVDTSPAVFFSLASV